MRQVNWGVLIAVFLGTVLFVLSLILVREQYTARTLFVENERAVDLGRRLDDDAAEMMLKIRRASLPGNISEGAAALGLIPTTGENTVNLVVDENLRVSVAPDEDANKASGDKQ